MVKWADYLVSAVSYNQNREITEVQVHEDLDGKMGSAEFVDKLTVSHNMRKGKTYVTIIKALDSWKRGLEIRLYSVGGEPYLRIDRNKVNLDNLGDIPEVDPSKKKDRSLTGTTRTGDKEAGAPPPPKLAGPEPKPEARPEPKPEARPEPKPEARPEPKPEARPEPKPEARPEPKPEARPEPGGEKPASPHGTLPAAGEAEIPFEDMQPEPVAAVRVSGSEPPKAEKKPKGKPDQEFLDYERDYLKRLEEQRKRQEESAMQEDTEQAKQEEIKRRARLRHEEDERQRRKSSEPAMRPEPAGSSRGSLPADGEIEIPFEDVQPEQAPADPTGSSRGSLPADGEIEIPFEDVQPEQAPADPAPEPTGSSRGSLPADGEIEIPFEDVQPEQAPADPAPEPTGSSRGSLPADGEIEIPFEDVQPEQAPADPAPEPGAEPEPEMGMLNFVDPARGPEHYVRRFLSEPAYKEWFGRNYPDHTIYQAIGISEEEFRKTAGGITPEPEPPESPHGTLPATGRTAPRPEQELPPPAPERGGAAGSGGRETGPGDGEDEEPTPEQLARFAELEKQLEKTLRQSGQAKARPGAEPEVPAPSPRGSLPAEGEAEIPFEVAQPEEAPAPSPRGSLPAEGEAEIPFEVAQPEEAPAPSPRGSLPAEGEAEIPFEVAQPEEAPAPSPRGSLPAEGEAEIPFEVAQPEEAPAAPEPEKGEDDDETATPEQVARLEALAKQVANLETLKARADAESEPGHGGAGSPATPATDPKETQSPPGTSDIVAYCARCKERRNMSNPRKTATKNGRPATRGVCHVCGAGMFKTDGSKAGAGKGGGDAPTSEQIDRVADLERQMALLEDRLARRGVSDTA